MSFLKNYLRGSFTWSPSVSLVDQVSFWATSSRHNSSRTSLFTKYSTDCKSFSSMSLSTWANVRDLCKVGFVLRVLLSGTDSYRCHHCVKRTNPPQCSVIMRLWEWLFLFHPGKRRSTSPHVPDCTLAHTWCNVCLCEHTCVLAYGK